MSPSLQCNTLVSPHPVMALKLNVENRTDRATEVSELSGANSGELTSVRGAFNQNEMLSLSHVHSASSWQCGLD